MKKELSNLTSAIERCQAVIQSFADEYIDCSEPEIIQAITARPEHYGTLFNVIDQQISDLKDQAARLEGALYESSSAGAAYQMKPGDSAASAAKAILPGLPIPADTIAVLVKAAKTEDLAIVLIAAYKIGYQTARA